jgi:deoxyribose-phosphate aldolase
MKSKYIDHTILKAVASVKDIEVVCKEAVEFNFASVCINPTHVKLASELLKGTEIDVCTVIGFPLGANTSAVKAFETKNAIENGATEIDMVLNIGALIDGDYDLVRDDIKAVVDAANGTLVKVILETCYLNEEQIVKACLASEEAGADFVKTSTGFGTGGATIEDVTLMAKTVPALQVKASGGVRTPEDFENMIKAGATRIGTSSGSKLISGQNSDTDY